MNLRDKYPNLLPIVFIVGASIVCWLPALGNKLGGDISFQQIYIECFSSQFWQGNLWPHWCAKANAGLGVPMLYPPLSYYVFAAIFPITNLGFSVYDVLTAGMLLTLILSGITCYLWLRDLVSPFNAAAITILSLFIPYRAEIFLFRTAYGEGWALVFMPLVFMYFRRVIAGDTRALYGIIISAILLILSHVPAALITAIICIIYLCVIAPRNVALFLQLAKAAVIIGLVTAPYTIPMLYYEKFTYADLMKINSNGKMPYPNTFMSLPFMIESKEIQLLLGIFWTWSMIIVMGIAVWRRRQMLRQTRAWQECVAWISICVCCWCLLLPFSEPVYTIFGPLKYAIFPWRMQLGLMFGLTALTAVWIQSGPSREKQKTWDGNYALVLLFMFFLYNFSVGIRLDGEDEGIELKKQYVLFTEPEYRTRWTDFDEYTPKYILRRPLQIPLDQRAEIIRGSGKISVMQWDMRGITLQASAKVPLRVRIDHNYFPMWVAHNDKGETVKLFPEEHTGRMLLDISSGEQVISLSHSLWAFQQP